MLAVELTGEQLQDRVLDGLAAEHLFAHGPEVLVGVDDSLLEGTAPPDSRSRSSPENGPCWFSTPSVLRRLTDYGLIERHAYAPRYVEYRLTALGQTLVEPIKVLTDWARENADAIVDFQERRQDLAS